MSLVLVPSNLYVVSNYRLTADRECREKCMLGQLLDKEHSIQQRTAVMGGVFQGEVQEAGKEVFKKRWREKWQPTPIFLPGKSHGQRSLAGYSSWGCQESDMTERLHFDFSLSCIGEGNGKPLQCSCLENPGTGEPGGLPSMVSHRVGHD